MQAKNPSENARPGRRRMPARRLLALVCAVLGLALIGYYVFADVLPKVRRIRAMEAALEYTGTASQSYVPLPVVNADDNYGRYTYPTDHFFTTDARSSYKSGDMVLRIPKLGLESKVMSGVTDATLRQGPGLYDYSALPSYGNPNVCIAAHRGVYGAEFYLLDKLGEGDLIELEYDGYLFTYQYKETKTVALDDWSLMYCTDYSAVTLSTCDMVDTGIRIVVRGELQSISPLPAAAADSAD